MVVFNELRVSKDGAHLSIGARVRQEPYYKDVYIKQVVIDTEETYGNDKPPIYTKTYEEHQKEISLVINGLETLAGFRNHLLFVYIITDGDPTPDTPCGYDERTTLGVTMWMRDFYNEFMANIKEMGDTCNVPRSFIDSILRYKALNISIDSGHYLQGIKFYNEWFKGNRPVTPTKKCGCNG